MAKPLKETPPLFRKVAETRLMSFDLIQLIEY